MPKEGLKDNSGAAKAQGKAKIKRDDILFKGNRVACFHFFLKIVIKEWNRNFAGKEDYFY